MNGRRARASARQRFGATLSLLAITAALAARLRAQDAPRALELAHTHAVCELLGLGRVGAVPYNFPGASRQTLATLNENTFVIPETEIAAGAHADVPLVAGGDLGAPFLGGDAKTYFAFGDSVFAQTAMRAQAANDDLFASTPSAGWELGTDCLALTIPVIPDTTQPQPITWNGPVDNGGRALGRNVVPGPGFSTGRFTFLLMPDGGQACSVAQQNCAGAGGLPGDVCRAQSGSDVGQCFFGECAAAPDSPCAARLIASTLAVRTGASSFVTPVVGEHIVSEAVLRAYRGHFATVSFYADMDWTSGNGVVWVLGRDSYWGTVGLTMSPYLMFHPVADGMLGEPIYFAGFEAGAPQLSTKPEAAVPVYAETQPVNHHSSLSYVPFGSTGMWLYIYGGHVQPVLRDAVRQFVTPVPESLLFDRDAGIFLRWARHPWGPWSDATLIFNPYTPGQGGFCEQMYLDVDDPGLAPTGFTCPPELEARNRALDRVAGAGTAGEYGAAIIPGRAKHRSGSDSFTLSWLLSTWNPYRVLMLQSELALPSQ